MNATRPRLRCCRLVCGRGASVLLGGLLLAAPGRAVVFHSTGDPEHNTTAPDGDLSGSGWQWQGNWRGFCGTPVAPHWFLTAAHLNGSVGEVFEYAGRAYQTTAVFEDPSSDLALWRVCGTFRSYAPLYPAGDEVGKDCVLHGTGLGRGGEVTVVNDTGVVLVRGWRWAENTQRLRWGTNRIAGTIAYGGTPGLVLSADFDAAGGAEEAMLTGGDSGGGFFVRRQGTWYLAGVALAVDGPFRQHLNGEDIWAAVFDMGGLYFQGSEGWDLTALTSQAQPAAAYATRVSARRDWIEATMAANPAPEETPQVLAAAAAEGPYAVVAAEPGGVPGTLRVPVPAATGFYQLLGCDPTRLVEVTVDGAMLVLRYEVQQD